MTLPLRKKHLTTAKSIRRKTTATNRQFEKGAAPLNAIQATRVAAEATHQAGRVHQAGRGWCGGDFKSALNRVFKTALLGSCSIYAVAAMNSLAVAQQPGWQPTRMPSQTDARPLATASQAASHSANPTTAQSEGQNSAVVLRWKSVTSSPAPVSNAGSNASSSAFKDSSYSAVATTGSMSNQPSATAPINNSLRSVRPAGGPSELQFLFKYSGEQRGLDRQSVAGRPKCAASQLPATTFGSIWWQSACASWGRSPFASTEQSPGFAISSVATRYALQS